MALGCTVVPLLASSASPETKGERGPQAQDVDPLAIDVLRAVSQPLERAQRFSFKARIGEEQPATDGQVVTLFHTVEVSVQRPDKVHIVFTRDGRRVDFIGSQGRVTMYAPREKVYTVLQTAKTIDETLNQLGAKAVDIPITPFLRSNLFELAAHSVTGAYVVGRTELDGKTVHQLAFTAPDANWQAWVTGGPQPRFVRVEIVNKGLPSAPRTTIEFLTWNLAPRFSGAEFTFQKPTDAKYASIRSDSGGELK